MLDKEEVVSDDTQTSKEEDRFFSNEIEDELDLGLEDDTDNTEPEEGEEVEEETNDDDSETDESPETDEPDKFKGKSREDIIKAYQNVEALAGSHAQTISELKKGQGQAEETPKKEYAVKDIPNISDNILDSMIATYEGYLVKPGASIDDADNYGNNTILYNRLMNEKSARTVQQRNSAKNVDVANATTVHEYKNKAAVTEAEYAKIIDFAKKKLSDTGEITGGDLDVAMHKLFPSKYNKTLADKDRKRIADAKTKVTPRITPGGSEHGGSAFKTIKEMGEMDDVQLDSYFESLSIDQLAEVKKLLNKK